MWLGGEQVSEEVRRELGQPSLKEDDICGMLDHGRQGKVWTESNYCYHHYPHLFYHHLLMVCECGGGGGQGSPDSYLDPRSHRRDERLHTRGALLCGIGIGS